jgi:antirestriction protein
MLNLNAWVGCVACYNAGRVVGKWCEAVDAGDLTIANVHKGQPCPNQGEELHCYDTEGLGILECSPSEATERAKILADAYVPDALLKYASATGISLAQAAEEFEDAYCGEYSNGEEFAQQIAEDIGALDRDAKWPMTCIDWAAAWRELELGEDYWSYPAGGGGCVYVFRSM